MRRIMVAIWLAVAPAAGWAFPDFTFSNIDGGEHRPGDWAGRPVLVVNTASLCGFTDQYDTLQALHDAYAADGLVVLAVPSNDFRQELEDGDAVKAFCEVNVSLTLPMTDITPVRGAGAHPFYGWVRDETGFVPRWNFNKVLIAPDGSIAGTWDSRTRPDAPRIVTRIRDMLAGT